MLYRQIIAVCWDPHKTLNSPCGQIAEMFSDTCTCRTVPVQHCYRCCRRALQCTHCKPTVWTRPACNDIARASSDVTMRTLCLQDSERPAVSPLSGCGIITLYSEYTDTVTFSKLSLTACSAAHIQKLPVPPPVNKCSAFYGNRMFTTVFTRDRHLSLSWIKSI